MKKLFLILTLTFSLTSQAQVELKPGIKFGMNIANITNTNYKPRPDFYAGGLLSIKFSDSYTLQPEWVYSRQGSVIEPVSSLNADIELHYLSVAIANKFSLFNKSNLNAVVGPFLDYRFKDNLEISFIDLFPIIFRWDIGLFVGLSYDIFSNFEFEVRYKRGFVDLVNINLNDKGGKNSNSVIQIGLNYKFDFKK